jgi:DNA-binding response OmpR family regulator
MRILLVEDESKVAAFVSRALREQTYAVDTTDCGERALELTAEFSYDIILLDIRLPGMSGIEVCRRFRELGVESPILMLTARSLVEQRVEGLDAGADDYLQKPFALAELHARIRALIRRSFKKGGSYLRYADLIVDRHRRSATRANQSISLTSKEFAVLEFLLLNTPNIVGRTELVEHVWDQHFDSETNLVEVYINRLRQKVDHNHEAKLIRTIRGIGYSLGGPK